MAIHVICPGCKKRFQVSEKFAGKRGPCPKCKAEIQIPAKGEDVKVHEPEGFGPKDKSGRAALKPIFREETKFSPVVAGIVGGVVLVVLIVALIVGNRIEDKESLQMWLALALGALVLAPPTVYGGYTFLRDDELEPYRGTQLWVRVAICSAVYAVIWGVMGVLKGYAFQGDEMGIWMQTIFAGLMILGGGGAAFVSLDVDYLRGLVHYGFYFLVTVLLRWVVGVGFFPQ